MNASATPRRWGASIALAMAVTAGPAWACRTSDQMFGLVFPERPLPTADVAVLKVRFDHPDPETHVWRVIVLESDASEQVGKRISLTVTDRQLGGGDCSTPPSFGDIGFIAGHFTSPAKLIFEPRRTLSELEIATTPGASSVTVGPTPKGWSAQEAAPNDR